MTQHSRGEHPGIVIVPNLQLEDLVRSRNNRVLAKLPLNSGDLRRRNSETLPENPLELQDVDLSSQ